MKDLILSLKIINRKIFFLFYLLLFNINIFALNFSIYPTRFNIDFTKNKTYEMKIINNTGIPLRINIFIEDIKGKKSLKKFIRIFPKKLSIKPGGKNLVRFNFKNIKSLPSGKYDTLLVASEVKEKDLKIKQNDEHKFDIKMYTEIALHIGGEKK